MLSLETIHLDLHHTLARASICKTAHLARTYDHWVGTADLVHVLLKIKLENASHEDPLERRTSRLS